MKSSKNGFTLAEVVVTLGIIAVIAAMTIPALVTNTKDKTIGPALGKAVHDIESGLQNIIHTANEKDLRISTLDVITFGDLIADDKNTGDYVITSDDMFTKLQGVTGVVKLNDIKEKEEDSDTRLTAYLDSAKLYSGNSLIKTTYDFVKSNGLVYGFPKSNSIFAYEKSSSGLAQSEDAVIARVMIDANGAGGPNRLGRDIFLFGIENNGKLIPAGSTAYNDNVMGNYVYLYTDATYGCNGVTVPSKSDGAPCAARVVADGWKIKYKK